MKKVLVILFVCLAVASSAVACDTCGCALEADAVGAVVCEACGETPCVCAGEAVVCEACGVTPCVCEVVEDAAAVVEDVVAEIPAI